MNEKIILEKADIETLGRVIGEIPYKYALPLAQVLQMAAARTAQSSGEIASPASPPPAE